MGRKKAERGYHHGNLTEELVAAGLELIQEKGVAALTLREIGSRLGVSRTAAYRHFADKAGLLLAISEAGFTLFGDALEAAREGASPDFASRLDAMAIAYARFAMEHAAYFEVMFGPCQNEVKEPAGERAFEILEGTIREGQEAGEVRKGDSEMLAKLVWSVVHGFSTLRLEADVSDGGGAQRFLRECGVVLREGMQSPVLAKKLKK